MTAVRDSACLLGRAQPAAQFTRWVVITLCFLVVIVPSAAIAEPDFWSSGEQWREAVLDALTDPYTWVPTAGAVVTGLTGLDHTIADWAVDTTPLFGSPESAEDASDYLLRIGHEEC